MHPLKDTQVAKVMGNRIKYILMMTHFNYVGVRRFVTSLFWSIHKVSVYNFLYGFMLRRKTFKLKRRKFTLVRLDKRKKIKKTAKGKTKIFVLFGARI